MHRRPNLVINFPLDIQRIAICVLVDRTIIGLLSGLATDRAMWFEKFHRFRPRSAYRFEFAAFRVQVRIWQKDFAKLRFSLAIQIAWYDALSTQKLMIILAPKLCGFFYSGSLWELDSTLHLGKRCVKCLARLTNSDSPRRYVSRDTLSLFGGLQ